MARRTKTDPDAVGLLEEAVHLLRRTPPATFAIYYAGAVPWTVGFLYFWAYTSWFAPGGPQRAWAALGLVGLFVALKAAQAEFCARLLAVRAGTPVPPPGIRRLRDVTAGQLRVQAWGVFLLPVALVLTVPFAWVYAFFQNMSVLGAGRDARAEAWRLARLWPGQNHVLLGGASVLAAMVWLNFAAGVYLVPWLANRLLGIENLFATRGVLLFNSTFIAIVTILTWLVIDPLLKAVYVLRVFYGRAQQTGEDLRVELAAAVPPRAAVLATVLAFTVLSIAVPSGRAAEPPAPAPASVHADPVALDREIERVLAQRDFQWALRPSPKPTANADEGGAIRQFLREGAEMVLEVIDSIRRAWGRVKNWLDELFKSSPSSGKTPRHSSDGGSGVAVMRLLAYTVIAAAIGLVGWIAWLMWRQGRAGVSAAVAARAVSSATPDLRDENVTAAQLPSEGWLTLAREQLAAGEWRLALRALYLATLARHAAEGRLTLAKFKTNLDYERELTRRASAQRELVQGFRGHRRAFEDVWYGRTPAAESLVRSWLRELEEEGAA